MTSITLAFPKHCSTYENIFVCDEVHNAMCGQLMGTSTHRRCGEVCVQQVAHISICTCACEQQNALLQRLG
jgi:hypothetical protein